MPETQGHPLERLDDVLEHLCGMAEDDRALAANLDGVPDGSLDRAAVDQIVRVYTERLQLLVGPDRRCFYPELDGQVVD